jgi:hypothetical protein
MRFLSALAAVMVIRAGFPGAHAQDMAKVCNIDCVLQKIDVLEQKVDVLQRTVDQLTIQIEKSIKSGQNVTLHTQNGRPGGCLTYFGPSGDKGGIVSWNVNCSADALWTIN